MISKKGLIEGILFASSQPVKLNIIAELLDMDVAEVKSTLEEIEAQYKVDDHGFYLARIAGGFQFRTKADLKEIMAKFYAKKPPRLTQAMLEVLSIVGYKQPITRPIIEKIRGVDSSSALTNLLERELIEMQGRSEAPGNPVIYGTTSRFLEWFQIDSLESLPPLSEMEELTSGIEEGAENLLGLLNKDEGFTSEALSEVDETLDGMGRSQKIEIPWEEKEESEEKQVETNLAPKEDTSTSDSELSPQS